MAYAPWLAGQRITAQRLADISGTWTSYTPTWVGLTALGASASTGRWARIGDTIHVIVALSWGTGSTMGTGALTASLPVAASAAPLSPGGWQGLGRYVPGDGSSWRIMAGLVQPAATTMNAFVVRWTDSGYVNPGTTPTPGYPWAAGSSMRLEVTYEAA
ncbi:hypothetical protein [Streptomyces sp. NPDC048442]|uniref:hypothetical protein n=1 Tax=Streptomyces sp. NPDC048442 TaxID=3154823 RepID=UPI003441E2EA